VVSLSSVRLPEFVAKRALTDGHWIEIGTLATRRPSRRYDAAYLSLTRVYPKGRSGALSWSLMRAEVD
jgi:hypothetical protein